MAVRMKRDSKGRFVRKAGSKRKRPAAGARSADRTLPSAPTPAYRRCRRCASSSSPRPSSAASTSTSSNSVCTSSATGQARSTPTPPPPPPSAVRHAVCELGDRPRVVHVGYVAWHLDQGDDGGCRADLCARHVDEAAVGLEAAVKFLVHQASCPSSQRSQPVDDAR